MNKFQTKCKFLIKTYRRFQYILGDFLAIPTCIWPKNRIQTCTRSSRRCRRAKIGTCVGVVCISICNDEKTILKEVIWRSYLRSYLFKRLIFNSLTTHVSDAVAKLTFEGPVEINVLPLQPNTVYGMNFYPTGLKLFFVPKLFCISLFILIFKISLNLSNLTFFRNNIDFL